MDLQPFSSIIEVLCDLPRKGEVYWCSKALKAMEVRIGDVLAVGTIVYNQLLSNETESGDVEFIDDQPIQPKRQSRYEISEMQMSW